MFALYQEKVEISGISHRLIHWYLLKIWFEIISQYFNRTAVDLYTEVIFEIYKGEAVLLKAADKIGLGSLLDEYKQNVRMAAKEVVEKLKISEGTARKIDQPFIPEEVYIEQMNRYWDSRMAGYKGE